MPPNPPPSKPCDARARRWRSLWIVLIVLGLAVLGFFPSLYVEETLRGKMAWSAYESEARKREVKLEIADFVPPPVPDAENFARTPLMDAAFRAADAGRAIPNPFKLPASTANPPNLSAPQLQRPLDLVAWQKYFADAKLIPAVGENSAADVLAGLDHFAAPLEELHMAARRPHCCYPLHWEKGVTADTPHHELLTKAAQLLQVRIAARLELGESAAACDDLQLGWQLRRSLSAEPGFFAGMMRAIIAHNMLGAVWDGLARRQWAETDIRRIETDLGGFNWLMDFAFAMESERGKVNATFDRIIRGSPPSYGNWYGFAIHLREGGILPMGYLYQGKLRSNLYLDECLARLDADRKRYDPTRPVPSSPFNITSYLGKVVYGFSALVTAPYDTLDKVVLRGAILSDQARLGCALERFRMARGAYPDELAALTPEFIAAVPADPLTGDPYRYRLTDHDFLLYSVGFDLQDDGGAIDPTAKTGQQKDLVWMYPAPASAP